MSKHYEQFCLCGAILGTVIELEAGVCMRCLKSECGDSLTRMCSECSTMVDDPSDLQGGRCAKCRHAEDKLAGRDRRGDLAALFMRQEDRHALEYYNLDMGLMRDSERAEKGQRK